MAETRGWHRILSGWYKYTNAAGKTLAFAEKSRGFWAVTVLPMADPAQEIRLSATPRTLRDAKQVAETVYKHQTALALKRQAEERARVGH